MRKVLLCVLTMWLLLLPGCKGPGNVRPEEELALAIREEYLAMTGCTARLSVTADYGQRVYEFELDAAVNGDETVLTVTAPELIAGVKARTSGEKETLEYEDVVLETGELGPDGLSPIAAFPALLKEAASGFIITCSMEEREGEPRLRVACGQPDSTPGEGVETVLFFQPETYALTEGEILVEGFRVIRCRCENFRFSG